MAGFGPLARVPPAGAPGIGPPKLLFGGAAPRTSARTACASSMSMLRCAPALAISASHVFTTRRSVRCSRALGVASSTIVTMARSTGRDAQTMGRLTSRW